MLRLTLFTFTVASVVLQCYAASTVGPGAATSLTSRFLKIQDFDNNDHYKSNFGIGEAADDLHTKDLDQLGSLAYAFRHQLREAIEELVLQALSYLRSIFDHLKVRFFKRLGKYTISDLFHATFNGVSELVKNASVDLPLDVEEEQPRPSYDYGQYPYFHHPYAMRSSSG